MVNPAPGGTLPTVPLSAGSGNMALLYFFFNPKAIPHPGDHATNVTITNVTVVDGAKETYNKTVIVCQLIHGPLKSPRLVG